MLRFKNTRSIWFLPSLPIIQCVRVALLQGKRTSRTSMWYLALVELINFYCIVIMGWCSISFQLISVKVLTYSSNSVGQIIPHCSRFSFTCLFLLSNLSLYSLHTSKKIWIQIIILTSINTINAYVEKGKDLLICQ